ncbi:MAG: pimeloyl-ACP methyl ester carboxylesterase [Halieaceae bacterium]|jgi:pimeloyl-ACP methyl ester carboxylesterase
MYIEVNGDKTFYATGSGDHKKEAASVVFIHGAGMDHTIWVMPSRHFARHGFNVVAPDLPGHGRSKGTALNSIDDMADWICALLRACELENAIIVGHSMGSLVALNLAARHPEFTNKLVLLGTSTPMAVADPLLDAARANSHAAIDMANSWSHSRSGHMGGNEVPGMWMSGSGERLLERAGENVYYADLSACNSFRDGEDLAAQVNCPSLVIIGTQDMMAAPVSSRNVAACIKGSRTIELARCGHAMLSEKPDEVLNALKSIIQE